MCMVSSPRKVEKQMSARSLFMFKTAIFAVCLLTVYLLFVSHDRAMYQDLNAKLETLISSNAVNLESKRTFLEPFNLDEDESQFTGALKSSPSQSLSTKTESSASEQGLNLTELSSKHKFPGRYNLIEEASRYTGALKRPPLECSLDLINTERLQQDHPCVINKIKKQFLHPPSNEPLNLDYPDVVDPSDGQTESVLYLLKNKTNGFFIECGALDGENLSNTLYMERYLNWTGLLVEADQEIFKNLLKKNRKAWASSACLSDDPYPQEVKFRASYALGSVVNDKIGDPDFSGQTGGYGRLTTAQCFPLYSILLAINRTEIDYFSLDIEGHELFVLKTIPFDRVNITVLSVEARIRGDREMEMYKEMVDYMKLQGYQKLRPKKVGGDAIFVKSDCVLNV